MVTITIENEDGRYAASSSDVVTADEYLELCIKVLRVASFTEKAIEDSIIQKADEIED